MTPFSTYLSPSKMRSQSISLSMMEANMKAHAGNRWAVDLPGLPFGSWLRVSAERRRLARLDPDQLADIGLSAAEARRESHRPFWDLPSGR